MKIGNKKTMPNTQFVYLAGISSNISKEEKLKAIQKTIEKTTDFSWFSKNDNFLIKPVINSGNPYPATTDPDAIIATIRLLKNKGAGRIIVGDLAGVGDVRFFKDKLEGSTRNLMKKTKIAQNTINEGGEIYCFEEQGWNSFYPEIPLQRKSWNEPLMIPSILKEIDHIILLPRCARHMMAGSSLGMKAVIGYTRTDTRYELHKDTKFFQKKIAEANTLPTILGKQRLILTVADKILTTYGPNNGYINNPKIGLIISSDSILAHDMVSLAWLLENRRNIPEKELRSYEDTSQSYANKYNKRTVKLLSGKRTKTHRLHKLVKDKIENIWDDQVLNHAFQICNGIPKVKIKSIDNILNDKLLQKLQEFVTFS